MGKLAQSASKYIIYINFSADGTVERPDVIGAVFGQTEGLLGQGMDLRELQQTGRVGRIDVDLKPNAGKTSGVITIPSSLDSSETALIAATMETIERIGPCNTKLSVDKIVDARINKRKYVVDRAQKLLEGMFDDENPEIDELSEQIKEAVRSGEIVEFMGLPAGPDLLESDSIIVVEGRADVLKLLRNGIRNTVAVQGTSIPPAVAELTKTKETTVFLDGDRGGDLILKELMVVGSVDFVAHAPEGKEVENLSKKEIFKALREKEPIGKDGKKPEKKTFERKSYDRPYEKRDSSETEFIRKKISIDPEKKEIFKEAMSQLTGTKAAYYYGKNLEPIGKVPIKEIYNTVRESKAEVVIMDGAVDQKTADVVARNGIKTIVGTSMERMRIPRGLRIVTQDDLE